MSWFVIIPRILLMALGAYMVWDGVTQIAVLHPELSGPLFAALVGVGWYCYGWFGSHK
jgi:hypothetical protein